MILIMWGKPLLVASGVYCNIASYHKLYVLLYGTQMHASLDSTSSAKLLSFSSF